MPQRFWSSKSIPDRLIGLFALWPAGGYSFLHANFMHLAVNMFGLYMFGRDVETAIGRGRLTLLYGTSVISGALLQLLFGLADATVRVRAIGASAGVFGLLAGLCAVVSAPLRHPSLSASANAHVAVRHVLRRTRTCARHCGRAKRHRAFCACRWHARRRDPVIALDADLARAVDRLTRRSRADPTTVRRGGATPIRLKKACCR
jgi:hypothetical protein